MLDRARASLEKARAACTALIAAVGPLAASKDFEAALKKLQVAFGVPELDQIVAERRSELVRLRDAEASGANQDRRLDEALMSEVLPAVMKQVRSRDFGAAGKAAASLVDELRTLDAKAEAQRYRAWIAAADKLCRGARESMDRLKSGDKVVFELRKSERVEGTVTTASGGAVIVGSKTISFSELMVESLVGLFERPLDGRSEPADRRGPALLAILEGDAPAARKYMEIVVRAGYEIPERVRAEYQSLPQK